MSRQYETVTIIETGRGFGVEAIEINSISDLRGIAIPLAEWRTIVQDYAQVFAEHPDWYGPPTKEET